MKFGAPTGVKNQGFFCILAFYFIQYFHAQELTRDWTNLGPDYTATACDITISTEVSNEQNRAFVNFSNDDIGCNMPNTFSNNDLIGQPSLSILLGYGIMGGTGVLTFNFSEEVTNPVLHIDRLGGGASNISTSVLLTLITPSITLERLSGNDNHFEVNGNEITRTPNQPLNVPANEECDVSSVGVAAGSIRLNGTFTSVSFRFEENGSGGISDVIDLVWELICTADDSDDDGIPDVDDLDDDNDGILDTVEQNNIPTLDTDSDGIIDSLDLDSDGDGCNDVIEAGFQDPDRNGTLGAAPDEVDANGLIINTTDGYTTPNDLNTNTIFDFQESLSPFIQQHPTTQIVCIGESAQFQVSIVNSTSITWEISNDNGASWNDISDTSTFSGIDTETLQLSTTSLDQNNNLFRVRIEVLGAICDPVFYSETAELRVLEPLNAGEDSVILLCTSDDPTNLFELLGNEVDPGGSWNPSLTNNDSLFDPSSDSGGTFTYTVGSGNCQDSATIEITIEPRPEIINIDILDTEIAIQIAISVTAPEMVEYSIDGTTYQNENTFEVLESGDYTVYVRSKNGCGTITETISVSGRLDYPNFFTPNEDGVNDTWQVEQIRIPNSLTYIFDRYGKLLKTLIGEEESWDGTYQNKRMPSTDYWFKTVVNDEIVLRGHFTLKR